MTPNKAIVALALTAALAIGWSATTSASAQNAYRQSAPVATAPLVREPAQAAQPAQPARRGNTGGITAPRPTATALTSGECTALGGEVKETTATFCGSAKFCKRTDQYGRISRMCIELGT